MRKHGRDLPTNHGGRRVAFDATPVWLTNLPAMFRSAALIFFLIIGTILFKSQYDGLPRGTIGILCCFGACVLMRLGWRVISTACMRLVIDDERLTWREGVFSRRVTSVELYRVQNVAVQMMWWERLAGFGTLIIETSDAAYPVWILPGVMHPEELREGLIRYATAMRRMLGVREFNMGQV